MSIPLNTDDRLYDGITNHRTNFENVYKKFGAAHSVQTGKHEYLKFKSNEEKEKPSIPNVKLFYTNKKRGRLQIIDGVGKAKELAFLQNAAFIHNAIGDLVLKSCVRFIPAEASTDQLPYGSQGTGVGKITFEKTSGVGRLRIVYDAQQRPSEEKWWLQILPLATDFSQMSDDFLITQSPGQIAIQLNFAQSRLNTSFYNMLFLNWVVYGK